MKILFLLMSVISLAGFAQPKQNNIDIGLFANGTNGSNINSGASLEFAFRIKQAGSGYTSVPVAEDFILYLGFPKTDFSVTDKVNIVQVNPAIYGSGTMVFQGVYDFGDPSYLYAGFAVFSMEGMNMRSLEAQTNAWSFAFTVSFTPAKTAMQCKQVRVIDQTNNAFLSDIYKEPVYTRLLMLTENQLTATAFSEQPVDILSFSGYKDGMLNQLKWNTTTEQNNKGFEVERSADSIHFTLLGFVNSKASMGNSSVPLDYFFTDNQVSGLTQYYRLRQLGLNGSSRFSKVVTLKQDISPGISIRGMYPNPVTDMVNLQVSSSKKDKMQLVLLNMNGLVMLERRLNVEAGSNILPVNVSSLPGGMYTIRLVNSGGEVTTAKMMKQ